MTSSEPSGLAGREEELDYDLNLVVAEEVYRGKKCRDSSWKGQYCCVPDCHNAWGGQAERKSLGYGRVSFHSFPSLTTDKDRALKWIAKIRRDPGPYFEINSNTKVCSDHFNPDDFTLGSADEHASRRVLKKTAIPSFFSWRNTKSCQRTTQTSQKARTEIQVSEQVTQQYSVSTDNFEVREQTVEDIDCPDFDSMESLQARVAALSLQVTELQAKYEKSLFRLANIKHDDDEVKFYTGFPDYDTLFYFYKNILESDAVAMRQWNGRQSKETYTEIKSGRSCKLPLLEQFFLTLVRLRQGHFERDLSNRFSISQSSVSRITVTWINLLYHSLKSLERYPPLHIVKKYMPESFKEQYPNTRLIIDATEFGIERPSSLVSQSTTFSAYKNKNTVKVLIGIMPSGGIVFISPTYEGSVSDKKLVELSGLLDKLEVGDEIMADKGFDIQDLLAPLGVRLNIPPFLKSGSQFSSDDVLRTKKIATLRIHVERAIGRIKEFRIFHPVIPATMWDSINELVYVCAMLCNFSPPLVC
ncbi:uncharacterized protein [Dysidea avara]|uniref:uncharacterized protein n=1 Tax=Dysidea avara TaxID=196820 RepID=UPI00331671E5